MARGLSARTRRASLQGLRKRTTGLEPATFGLGNSRPDADSVRLAAIPFVYVPFGGVIIAELGTRFGTRFAGRGRRPSDQRRRLRHVAHAKRCVAMPLARSRWCSSSEAQVSERPRARKLAAHCASQRRDRETAPARSKQHSRVSRLPPGTDAWRRKRLVRGQVEAIATCPKRARLRAAAGRSHWEVKASAWRLACRANEGTRRRRPDACRTATVSTTCRAQNRRRRSGRPRR